MHKNWKDVHFFKEKYLGKNQLAEKNEYYSVCMRHSNGINLILLAKEFTFSGEDVFLNWCDYDIIMKR